MIRMIKKSTLASIALVSLGVSTHAEELLIWQVPEVKGKPPIFYQEASQNSKTVATFKPHQTLIVLANQKDWVKVSTLDNSGQIAWVAADAMKGVTKVNVSLKQEANNYHCQVRIKDPEGRETGHWRLAHRMLEPSEKGSKGFKGWGFGRKNATPKEDEWMKELGQFEEAFAKQHAAMMNMMRHMFSVTLEEPVEKVKSTHETTQVTENTKVEESAKPNETKLEEKKSVAVKQEK